MPSCPVYAAAGRASLDAGATIANPALDWAGLLAGDPDARKILWAWASCRATGESFGGLCRAMGWPRASAEVARRRGAVAIAALLEAADRPDRGSTDP